MPAEGRARRPFYAFHTATRSPLAAEVLARIGRLCEIEAGIRGQPPDVRRAVRQLRSRPLVEDPHRWLQEGPACLAGLIWRKPCAMRCGIGRG